MMFMLIVFTCILTGLLGAFVVRLQLALGRSRLSDSSSEPSSHMPTVSICIPARNEVHAMTQCLERALESDYEKIEIIVFDDSSADDTSILVRSFAHAGVRFVPGTHLPEGWLGKNHALEVLAREASGEYIIFMDVDTSIEPTTISRLVNRIMTGKLEMISVVPERKDVWRASVLLSPLRYFWQLILSSPTHPTASSSLWSIKRDVLLERLGGIGEYKSEVQPEVSIAARIEPARYQCIAGGSLLGVAYEKKWLSQLETSRRLLYPTLGRSWWRSLVVFAVLVVLNLPTVTLISAVLFGWTESQVMALWFLAAYMAVYGMYTSVVWRGNWWIGGLMWPFAILQELVLFISSMWGYARHTITWKGRLLTSSTSRADRIEISE